MAQLEDEEEQYLATLHELEATQEDIASYQGLLKDLPEIYERKFNERLKPILDRQHQLIDKREQLLQQLHQSLPTPEAEPGTLLAPAPPPLATPAPPNPPRHPGRWRPWWFMGLAALGLTIGLQWHNQTRPGPPATPPKDSAAPLQPQTSRLGAPASGKEDSAMGVAPELAPATTLRDRVVERAVAEWTFFERPTLQAGKLLRVGRQEGDSGQWQRVITYWREGLQNNSVNDPADVRSRDHPWSAAFIAYVMKQAGAGDQFPYAASHSGSIKEAIYNRQHSMKKVHLIGHRVTDYSPQPGDLLCATRSWATGKVNYDNAIGFEFFPSRCELVIRTASGQIITIGGDLKDAVTLHIIKARNGKIAPESARDWLVAIQTQIN
ncbi:MAG: DUF2272 domain-containing protein [Cyanobacteriota bacterium]|nr:DUF2272 domain-containing protein [Cyanobacteriota bacterium]